MIGILLVILIVVLAVVMVVRFFPDDPQNVSPRDIKPIQCWEHLQLLEEDTPLYDETGKLMGWVREAWDWDVVPIEPVQGRDWILLTRGTFVRLVFTIHVDKKISLLSL